MSRIDFHIVVVVAIVVVVELRIVSKDCDIVA